MKAAAKGSGLMKNGRAPIEPGTISKWTETRDLPAGDGVSFRSWFAARAKNGKDTLKDQ